MWYQGVARYLLLDADAHTAVLKAEGGEIRGQGNGTALVTVTLSPSPRGTKVQVVTVLSIDGKLAQFAGDALTALSRNRIPEFAENLEFSVLATPKAATAEAVVETHAAEADQQSLRRVAAKEVRRKVCRSRAVSAGDGRWPDPPTDCRARGGAGIADTAPRAVSDRCGVPSHRADRRLLAAPQRAVSQGDWAPVAGLLGRAPKEPLRSPRTVSRIALPGLSRDKTTPSEAVGLVGTTPSSPIIVVSIPLEGSSRFSMVVVEADPSGLQIRS